MINNDKPQTQYQFIYTDKKHNIGERLNKLMGISMIFIVSDAIQDVSLRNILDHLAINTPGFWS